MSYQIEYLTLPNAIAKAAFRRDQVRRSGKRCLWTDGHSLFVYGQDTL